MAQPTVAEPPRRMDDGTVFMPKPSQRLLTIRTGLATPGEALATTQMVGTLGARSQCLGPGAAGPIGPAGAR